VICGGNTTFDIRMTKWASSLLMGLANHLQLD
jgi:hypothetical protein